MLQALRQRVERDEEGFTLIELMVVVLIIAILIAIAIPTFLGARQRAQDRAAQSNLRNALTAEKTYYTDNQAYTASSAAMTSIEPSISWQTTTPTTANGNLVGVVVGDVTTGATVAGGVVCLSAFSASGTTFALVDISAGTNAGTYYSKSALSGCTDSTAGLLAHW